MKKLDRRKWDVTQKRDILMTHLKKLRNFFIDIGHFVC